MERPTTCCGASSRTVRPLRTRGRTAVRRFAGDGTCSRAEGEWWPSESLASAGGLGDRSRFRRGVENLRPPKKENPAVGTPGKTIFVIGVYGFKYAAWPVLVT